MNEETIMTTTLIIKWIIDPKTGKLIAKWVHAK